MTLWLTENMELAVGVALLLVGLLLVAVILSAYLLARQSYKLSASLVRIQALEKKTELMSSGSLGLGQRVMALEKQLRSLQNLQEDIRQGDLEFSYTQAQKLVEQGLDSRTIAANSGLSESEVDLMRMLYGQGRQTDAA